MVNHKEALERLWTDRCTVFVRVGKTNPETKLTDFVEHVLLTDQPCKLSFETLTSTSGDGITVAFQSVKLILSSDVDIPSGSKITVIRKGRATDYSQSGKAGVFTNHQEIVLELFRGWV